MAESRTVPAVDPRSAATIRSPLDARDPRDPRSALDSRATRDPRDPRDAAYGRDSRATIEPSDRDRRAVAADNGRDTRAAAPIVTRDARDPRDSRNRLEETSSRETPKNDYFLPGEDISREVITNDICRYLGADALVRPYNHPDVSTKSSFAW